MTHSTIALEARSVDLVVAEARPRSAPWRANLGILIAIIVVIGFTARVGTFFRNPSLWIDEAMLALNVANRSPSELFQPLDMNQGAPVGFLLLSKAVTSVLGTSEPALRLVPFLASLVSLGLFVAFVYRTCPRDVAHLATVLFSLSPYLIGYAGEFKQYGFDALLALTLSALAFGNHPRLLLIVGAAAVWCSHPAVFVLAAIGCVRIAEAGIANTRTAWLRTGTLLLGWLVSFAICYFFFLRKLGMNAYLLDYWAGSFLTLPPIRPGDWAWIVHHFCVFFDKPGGFGGEFGLAGYAALCYLLGAITLAKTDWKLAAELVLPLLFAMLASGLRKYPFAGRLLLFAVPLAIPLVAYGAMALAHRVRDLGRGASALVIAALIVGVLGECNQLRKKPLHTEDVREMSALLREQWQPGDRVFVTWGAMPAFRYYHRPGTIPEEAVVFGLEKRSNPGEQLRSELQSLQGQARVWVLTGHRKPTEDATLKAYLETLGQCEYAKEARDAALVRYDLSRK